MLSKTNQDNWIYEFSPKISVRMERSGKLGKYCVWKDHNGSVTEKQWRSFDRRGEAYEWFYYLVAQSGGPDP